MSRETRDGSRRDEKWNKDDDTEDESAVTAFAHRELERFRARAASLELANRDLVVAKRRAEAQAEARVEKERRGLKAERDALEAERVELTEREQRLKAFASDRASYENELALARGECERLTATLATERAEMERSFAARMGETRAECDARVQRTKETAESTMTARMERSVKRILAQNRKMSEELRVQVSETDALHQRYETASDEAESLRRRVVVMEDVERERAELDAMRAKEMRKADEKIVTLERGIRELMEAFETQKAEWEREASEARSICEEEVAHLRRSLALKSRELTNIRRLAKEVVCHYEDV